jgi:hypothetical protein
MVIKRLTIQAELRPAGLARIIGGRQLNFGIGRE